jgi:uncharacterized protein YjdB
VTAVSNGTVTARATANDGSGVVGSLVITISNQVIPVTGITVTGSGGSSIITTDNGTLQLTAAVSPTNATNQTVTWSIVNGTGQATISSSGLVTAVSNGTVTARAIAKDESGVFADLEITIQIPELNIRIDGNILEVALNADYSGYKLCLHNILGNALQEKNVNGNMCQFDISTVPNGIYLIVLSKSVVYIVEKISIIKIN